MRRYKTIIPLITSITANYIFFKQTENRIKKINYKIDSIEIFLLSNK